MRHILFFTILITVALSWQSCAQSQPQNLADLPAMVDDNTIRCVIEIPAGTNKKIEYSDSANAFRIDQRNGEERIISYLPYPANYGFIPSTESRISEGGDGDHLDVVLLCESLDTGSVVEAMPIAVLKLLDNGENDFKFICIPKDLDKQIIHSVSLNDLRVNYPGLIEILNIWFTSYDGNDTLELIGWGDEIESLEEIKKSIK